MPQNIFKIFDGRNYFWQWDTNQKLIVLDDTIDEVHFSNRDMTHAISKDVFTDKDGKRVCYIPDTLLTLPKNLIAAAIVTDNNATKTLKQVKFAVQKRPIPSDYIVSDDVQSEDITDRLNIVEEIVADMRLNLPNTYDTKGSAEQALADAKLYMRENYDPIGSAESVMNNLTEEIARAKNEEAAITRALHQINDRVTDTQSDVSALEKFVGVLPNGVEVSTIVDYIDKKTEGIALDESIPTKTSDLTNDSGYITGYTETDPTVPAWAKASQKPNYTPEEIGAQPAGNYLTEDDLSGYATENFVAAKIAEAELSGSDVDLSGYATKDEIPTKTSQLTNDSGFITSYTETDPTVPAWAKASTKPTYTASEVGALPDTTVIPTVPTKVSAFTNDAGYLTEHQSLAAYAKTADLGDLAKKDSLTASDVGADASGTASSLVSEHNSDEAAHADIRGLISELSGQNVDYLLMNSPDGTVWKITVSNSGVITATKVSGGDPENSPGLSSYTIFVPENVSDEWKVTGNYGELDMSTADFLELFYDGFVSAPPSGVTVAKNSIGKDESGQYDMWEYDFCPTNYSRTILLSSGMHTYELSASFGLANFIGHLYTDTGNDAFDYIRNNVRVKVIPVVNPWGFNQYPKTYGNVNGVNPNRNFDLDGAWASFPTYTPEQDECNVKGDSPFCEAEAVNLARWAEANWDAEFWIDCHTGEGHDDKDLWVYYASDAVLLDRINAGISRIETWFKETYGTDCVTTRTIDSEGSIRLFWAEKIAGIPGITLEQAPKRTTFGTSALNEAADISNYSTNISTFVQEFLLEKYRNTVEVNIVSAENPADITMDASTLSVTISAEISPVDTTQNHFLWTSDDDSVCEVYGGSNKAVVVAIGEGTATVTGVNRYDPSIKVTCGITVSYEQMATEITAMSAAVQGVSSTTGELIANNSRMASDFTEVTAGSQLTISCANGYLLKAFEYDSNYALLSDSIGMNFDASEISGTLATDCKYIRLLLKRPDNDIFVVGDISQTEITINENTFKLTEYTTDVSATNQELGVKIGYTLDLTTGVETENANRSVTDFIPLNGASMTFGFDANYAYAAKAFNTDKSLSSANISGHIPNWGHGACTLPSSVQSGLGYIRFLVKNSDNSAMTDIPRYIVINDEIYMLVAVE